jgi:hypothetical protein
VLDVFGQIPHLVAESDKARHNRNGGHIGPGPPEGPCGLHIPARVAPAYDADNWGRRRVTRPWYAP